MRGPSIPERVVGRTAHRSHCDYRVARSSRAMTAGRRSAGLFPQTQLVVPAHAGTRYSRALCWTHGTSLALRLLGRPVEPGDDSLGGVAQGCFRTPNLSSPRMRGPSIPERVVGRTAHRSHCDYWVARSSRAMTAVSAAFRLAVSRDTGAAGPTGGNRK